MAWWRIDPYGGYYDYRDAYPQSMTVEEKDSGAEFSGLYSPDGEPLYREGKKQRIGFI